MVKNPTKKANARHLCAHLDMIEKTVEKNATSLAASFDPETTDVITHKDWGSGYAGPAKRPDVKSAPALEKRVQESVAEVTAKSLSQEASSVSRDNPAQPPGAASMPPPQANSAPAEAYSVPTHDPVNDGAHLGPSNYLAPLLDGAFTVPPGVHPLPNQYHSHYGAPAPYVPAPGAKATGATAASQTEAAAVVTASVETPPGAPRTAAPGPAAKATASTGKTQPNEPPALKTPPLVLSSRTSTAGGASLVSVDSAVEISIKEEEPLFV